MTRIQNSHLCTRFEISNHFCLCCLGVVLNRILNAGWSMDELILSGSLETRFGVNLHGCLYVAKVCKR